MNVRTINLTGSEVAVKVGGGNSEIKNNGVDTIYASASSGVIAGADGVVSIPAGASVTVTDTRGTVYILGTGSVEVVGKGFVAPVFKSAATSGGGGTEDEVARNAINAHAGNAEIHVTEAEKTAWDGKAELTDIPSSLPANGGNADTLDGNHASEFAPYHSYAPIYTGDILDISEMGTYSCFASECTNVPAEITSACYITMYQFRDAGYKQYICVPLNALSETQNTIWLASESYKDSNGKLIWNKSCDGGNAELLGNHPASDFVLKSDYDALAARVAALENGGTT